MGDNSEEDGAGQTIASAQILVLAGNTLIRWDICDRLRGAGIIPIEAVTADEAIDLLDEFNFRAALVCRSESLIPLSKYVRARFPGLPIISSREEAFLHQYEELGVTTVASYEPSELVQTTLRAIWDARA